MDFGVVLGLGWGTAAVLFFWLRGLVWGRWPEANGEKRRMEKMMDPFSLLTVPCFKVAKKKFLDCKNFSPKFEEAWPFSKDKVAVKSDLLYLPFFKKKNTTTKQQGEECFSRFVCVLCSYC